MFLSRSAQNYVDFPKKNGYRSVHTTVVHPTGIKMEFQVKYGLRGCSAVVCEATPHELLQLEVIGCCVAPDPHNVLRHVW